MDQNIEEIEFTIFDTETTGLNPASGDRIVELAGLRVRGSERIAKFDALVNPARLISPGAFAVNKITPDMLKDAPDISVVLPKFLNFISGGCLCSYNAEFDMGFLNHELYLLAQPLMDEVVVLDVLTMAKKLLPGLARYALWFVAAKLEIELTQKHRAFADVEMTWEVFSRLKAIGRQKGINGFTNFSNLFAFNPVLLESSNLEKSALIQKYIAAKQALTFCYLSSHSGEVTRRKVIPQLIRQDNKYRYLVANCGEKNEQCIFRLDNILDFEVE